MGPTGRLALPRGERPAVYETAAVATEPRRHEMVGRLGFAPSSRRLRAGTSLSKFATRSRHEGGVEPPSRFRIGFVANYALCGGIVLEDVALKNIDYHYGSIWGVILS